MNNLESKAFKISNSIGTVWSLILHTLFFAVVLLSPLFGIDFEKAMLILTTVVSLEAIYLAIFIQMSVNKNTAAIQNVEKDIDEIQEDVEDIQEDVEEIQEEIDEIQEDVEDIQEDVEEIQDTQEDENKTSEQNKISQKN